MRKLVALLSCLLVLSVSGCSLFRTQTKKEAPSIAEMQAYLQYEESRKAAVSCAERLVEQTELLLEEAVAEVSQLETSAQASSPEDLKKLKGMLVKARAKAHDALLLLKAVVEAEGPPKQPIAPDDRTYVQELAGTLREAARSLKKPPETYIKSKAKDTSIPDLATYGAGALVALAFFGCYLRLFLR